MGHRASYAVVREGRRALYASRWGAVTLPQDLFYGPDPAIRYVESLMSADGVFEDPWCEGAVLLNVDARHVLWFAADCRYHAGLRRHFLPLMGQNWPGWSIRWADDGIAEVAAALGIVLAPELDESDFAPSDMVDVEEDDVPANVISIRRGGRVDDYGSGAVFQALTQLLARGPALVDACEGRPTIRLAEDPDLESGAFLDVDRREVWVWWNGRKDARVVDQIARYWPGWTVRRHVEGLMGHVERSGRDPGLVAIPRDEALRQIVELLAEDNEFDPAAFLRHLGTRGEEAVSVAPGFLRVDKLGLDAAEKEAILARAVEAWRAT